jgi:hypothetical protein
MTGLPRAFGASPIPGVAARAVPRVDGWRRGPRDRPSASASFKEWMHFCVAIPGEPAGHLLVNINILERMLPTGPERTPRLIALGVQGDWTGVVESFEPRQVSGRAGEVDLDLGPHRLRWRDGGFDLEVRSAEVAASLRLHAVALPTVATSVSFGAHHSIHWVVVPRLEASGWVAFAGRRFILHRAPAYHDHNWGHFRWGGDLAWEWGFVLPSDAADPWSAVFARVSDGGRHRTLSQSATIWRAGAVVRTFQDRELHMTLEGSQGSKQGPRPFTLPPVASLLVPGAARGVPARVVLEARGHGEELRIDFESTSQARVAIPSDVDPFRLVILNEVAGQARARGALAAGAFDVAGPAVMEFVRG